MKAVRKTQRGAGFVELVEIEEPVIADDEVLIEVKAVAICGSDLHIYQDEHPYWPPVTMGHEFSGQIAAVGRSVSGWQVGDRVVSETRTESCGRCRYCQSGSPQICPEKRPLGIGVNGAMARYIATPARLLHRMPDTLSYDEASLVEPTAICIHSLLERTGVVAGESVVICGAGPIGLLSLQIAKAAGAAPIVVTGTPRSADLKLRKAKDLGADYVVNIGEEDPQPKVLELTEGYGADLVIEASGASSAIGQSFHMVRRHGKICAIGVSGKPTVAVPWDVAIFKASQVTFCFSSSWTSWETALSLLARGAIRAEPLITHRAPLADWEDIFQAMINGQVIKAILHP